MTAAAEVDMAVLEISGLRKQYGTIEALRGINLSVESGELFGLLGPNGAGKTSTIHIITGLVRPDAGSVIFRGEDCIAHRTRAQQFMGIVPDESNLYEEMTGFENLCFCAALYGMRKHHRQERARELLSQFSLLDAAHRPFKGYSKGMKRKLVIAAGIIHQPDMLFFDEPTTGIDVESARHIRSLIRSLNRQGTTILLTTHYLEEAQRLCGRIAFIAQGSIVKTGKVDELLEQFREDQTVEIVLDGSAADAQTVLKTHYPELQTFVINDQVLHASAETVRSIAPIAQILGDRGYQVYEIKRIRPTLEEVFVSVTGIGQNQGRTS